MFKWCIKLYVRKHLACQGKMAHHWIFITDSAQLGQVYYIASPACLLHGLCSALGFLHF